MSRWLGIVSLVVSVIAAAIAFSAGVFNRPGHGVAAPAPSMVDDGASPRAGSDPRETYSRLASIESDISALARRVSALERNVAAKPGDPARPRDDDARQVERLRSDVDALLTGEALATEAGRKRLKEVLRTVQDEVFAERFQERMTQMDQERADRVKKFASEAGLSSGQEAEVKRVLDVESQQRRALFEQFRTGQGTDPRNNIRALRENTDTAVKNILTPDQFPKYQQMRQEERRAWGPPGGMGGPPPQ